jgi:3-deoxy-D-manno-octulosonic-acid transferase
VTRALYSLLMWLGQPLLRRKLMRRGKLEAGYHQHVEERFGRYDAETVVPANDFVWVHAVSLGETRAAALLIGRLRERLPGLRLLLTHGTATGRAEGLKLLRPGDRQVWLPWDTPGAVQRFLGRYRPRLGVLMETELWPNLSAACARHAVPLVMVNARLSEKSLRQARRMAWLARPAYRSLTAVWAQTEDDARRLTSMGAPVKAVLGNLKFDATPDAAKLAQGRAWRAAQAMPVVVLAVSREGEEVALLALLADRAANDAASAAVQWLIVPRHPQRFDAVAALIEQHGFKLSRRSAWSAAAGPGAAAPPGAGSCAASAAAAVSGPASAGDGGAGSIWLGDSLGEMALYYGLADVALLGGSFEPLGGQNLIEAAACGCPIVMGPHTFNFAQAAQLAQACGAALRVDDMAAALHRASALAHNTQELAQRQQVALQFAQAHGGALDRTCDGLLELLGQQRVDRT